MNIIALDLSLTRTGIAAYDRLGGPRVRSVDTTRLTGHACIRHILHAVIDELSVVRFDLAVLEDLPAHNPAGIRGVLDRARLFGVIEYYLAKRVPMVHVSPTTLKVYATGKGRGAGTGKDDIRVAVDRRYGDIVRCGNHDEADAFVLLCLALDAYGLPLMEVPQTHRRAIKVANWPDLQVKS